MQESLSMDLQNDKFYLIDVDENVILDAGPFDSSDDGDDWLLETYNINTLYNSNPFSFWSGASIKAFFDYPFEQGKLEEYDLAAYGAPDLSDY
jgi:hypothetical protein